jgi:hypothetical protein
MTHADTADDRVQLVRGLPGQPGRIGYFVAGAPHVVLGAVVWHRAHQQREPVNPVAVPERAQQGAQPGGQLLALRVGEHPHPGMGQPRRGAPPGLAGVVHQTDPALVAKRRAIWERHPRQHPRQVRLVRGQRRAAGRLGLPPRPPADHPDLIEDQVPQPAQGRTAPHRHHHQAGQQPADRRQRQGVEKSAGRDRPQHRHREPQTNQRLPRGQPQDPTGVFAPVEAAIDTSSRRRHRIASSAEPALAPPPPGGSGGGGSSPPPEPLERWEATT